MILETTFETSTGAARVIDFMTRREGASDLVRIVKGLRGKVAMHTELVVRFEYGFDRALGVAPGRWAARIHRRRRTGSCSSADTPLRGEDLRTVGKFEVEAGDEVGFMLTWSRSYRAAPAVRSVREALGVGGVVLEQMVGAFQAADRSGRKR